MRQFIGSVRDDTTVQGFLVELASPAVRAAWDAVEAAELTLMETDDDAAQLAYADALAQWGDAGGYDAEVTWDTVTVAALGVPYDRCKYRELSTLSGGEQKRLALEALLRGPDEVLLLDEPDNYLDVPGKRWLEERLLETRKTGLFVSHDRELLARIADRVVTVEGGSAWVHGGGFVSYHEARTARHDRLAEPRRRWDEEHERLIDLVRTLQQQAANSPDMASRYRAMQTRLAKFEEAGPPPDRPPEQKVAMRLRGGRTGVRAVIAEQLELSGLMRPFDTERRYGLADSGDQLFRTLSGGQQARFQILLLELSGATLLLLDEPTDNLDVLSAEALEDALETFEGTVIAVTHDRWFARRFDRFLIFGADGVVAESTEPVFDAARVVRPR